jgi:hypothetical protein
MKQTISVYGFRDAFQSLRPDNFSYDGLGILFDYLEELEQVTGEETELDVIAICCDWCESDAETIAQDFDIEVDADPDEEPDEYFDEVLAYLQYNTMVAGHTNDGQIVYLSF